MAAATRKPGRLAPSELDVAPYAATSARANNAMMQIKFARTLRCRINANAGISTAFMRPPSRFKDSLAAGNCRRGLFGLVANGFHVVAVGIDDECAVVVRMV